MLALQQQNLLEHELEHEVEQQLEQVLSEAAVATASEVCAGSSPSLEVRG